MLYSLHKHYFKIWYLRNTFLWHEMKSLQILKILNIQRFLFFSNHFSKVLFASKILFKNHVSSLKIYKTTKYYENSTPIDAAHWDAPNGVTFSLYWNILRKSQETTFLEGGFHFLSIPCIYKMSLKKTPDNSSKNI